MDRVDQRQLAAQNDAHTDEFHRFGKAYRLAGLKRPVGEPITPHTVSNSLRRSGTNLTVQGPSEIARPVRC